MRWIALAVVLVGAAAVWIAVTSTRPTYDAFGWLTWGRQILHWNLNTDGAPSWKPLIALFTVPFAIPGAQAELWLWIFTATCAALLGVGLAGHIAYRLTGPSARRPWAPWAAAVFAGASVLSINGYAELVLITNSDPMIMTLCLGAIDSHLSGRRRLAFLLLVAASLGRPEAWAFAFLYGAWAWRREPAMRWLVAVGLVLIPLTWFGVSALTSHSWLRAGDLALNSPNVIHGNKAIGVVDRVRNMFGLPQQLAILFALGLAVVTRRRTWLVMAGAALLWVAIEIAFAYHGWSAVPRYLLEPAAVLIVLGGAGVGWALAYENPGGGWLQWLPTAVVLALVVALIPTARSRARMTHSQIDDSRVAARELSGLERAISRAGGAAAIRACGQPTAGLQFQSELAWALGMNVGNVGWRPGHMIAEHLRIVLFTPSLDHWKLQPMFIPRSAAATCARVSASS